MRVVFAGTPETAVPALDAVLASQHEVAAVVTRPDAPAGRGRTLSESPVARRASEAGVPTLKPAKVRDPEFLDRLREIEPDCCAVVAYGALIPPVALEIPEYGWINLHFSLLPAWRGAAPVQHAILAGDDVTGATTFRLEEGLDTGPIYSIVTESVGSRDTSGDLLERLSVSGAELLDITLDALETGALMPDPQPEEGVSFAPKLAVDDARLDWAAPAQHVDRLVRACSPAPGAWTTFRGERLKLGPVAPLGGDTEAGEAGLAPGELRSGRHRVLVGTGSQPLELGEVQPQGRRRMHAAEWARGVHPATGDRLV